MSDADTAARIRKFFAEGAMPFSWPTDACGYDQHIRFVHHRNKNFTLGTTFASFKAFALDYADKLERGEIPPLESAP